MDYIIDDDAMLVNAMIALSLDDSLPSTHNQHATIQRELCAAAAEARFAKINNTPINSFQFQQPYNHITAFYLYN